MYVLEQVPHRHVKNLGLVFADEGGVSEHLQDDHAVQVAPCAEEESARWRGQGFRAVWKQGFQMRLESR